MTICLPGDLERFVREEVRAGRYLREDDVVSDALERLRRRPEPSGGGSLGAMRDDAESLDRIVEGAMRARVERPWRVPDGEKGAARHRGVFGSPQGDRSDRRGKCG